MFKIGFPLIPALLSSKTLRYVTWTLICLLIWISLTMAFSPAEDGLGPKRTRCCVPNCKNTRADVFLHSFPNPEREPTRFRTWLYAVGGEILALKNEKIFKDRKVCRLHFQEKYFCGKRLTTTAVPTLHLTAFSIQRQPHTDHQPMQDITNIQVHTPRPSTSKGATDMNPGLSTMDNMEVPSSSRMDKIVLPTYSGENKPDTFKTLQTMPSSSKGRKLPLKLYDDESRTIMRAMTALQKKNLKYKEKLKQALKLSQNPTFLNAVKKFTSSLITLMMLQFREFRKDKMGRRFTKYEKILALSLYKQGPKSYRFMRSWMVLPSPATLSRIISAANLMPGLNDNLFGQLKKRGKKMTKDEKLCILLFDEMALAPHFDYNKKQDKIIGFVDSGTLRKKKIADHALVFMVRGVTKNYKLPLLYSFCSGTTPTLELAILIKEMIKKLKFCGFTVVATVCDQGATNSAAINNLIEETRKENLRKENEWNHKTFLVDGSEIIPLFDPPHLIKCIRNHLLTKNLICTMKGERKIAKWEHIQNAYDENPSYKGLRLPCKLTQYHVNPQKIPKMRVKYATQVFSRSVGVNMGFLADKGILPPESRDTADVIIFFDELFDSMNGSQPQQKKGKKLLGPLTPTSSHHSKWNDAKKVLSTMRFINSNNKHTIIPTFKNWMQTIDNLVLLRQELSSKYKLNSLWLRHFNQDPLENFFGCIRSHGYRNNNPTCTGFQTAFAALLINNMSSNHSPGSNCEKDKCVPMKAFKKLFFSKMPHTAKNLNQEEHTFNMDDMFMPVEDIETKLKDIKIKSQLEYVSGYIVKKARKNIFRSCKACASSLLDENFKSQFIAAKEYYKSKNLSYPSKGVIGLVSGIQDVTTHILKNNSLRANLKSYAKTVMFNDFEFISCQKHKAVLIEFLENYTITFFINIWARDSNKLLTGSRVDFNNEDDIQKMAYHYCMTRLKKKNKV